MSLVVQASSKKELLSPLSHRKTPDSQSSETHSYLLAHESELLVEIPSEPLVSRPFLHGIPTNQTRLLRQQGPNGIAHYICYLGHHKTSPSKHHSAEELFRRSTVKPYQNRYVNNRPQLPANGQPPLTPHHCRSVPESTQDIATARESQEGKHPLASPFPNPSLPLPPSHGPDTLVHDNMNSVSQRVGVE